MLAVGVLAEKERAERRNYACKKTVSPQSQGRKNLKEAASGGSEGAVEGCPGLPSMYSGVAPCHPSVGAALSRSLHSEPWF